MRIAPIVVVSSVLFATEAEADLKLSFSWGDIPLCTSGQPNIVPNPRFVLTRVPEGTERVDFHLTDLDAPGYEHGGGSVPIERDGTVLPGAFTYKSPCPPSGVHNYEWRAVAYGAGMILGEATAQHRYPE